MQDFIYQSFNLGAKTYNEVHHPLSKMGLGCRKIKFPLVLDTKIYNVWYYLALHIFKKQLTTTVNFKYSYACSELLLMRLYCLQLGIQKNEKHRAENQLWEIWFVSSLQQHTGGCRNPSMSLICLRDSVFFSSHLLPHSITWSTATSGIKVLQTISLCTAKSWFICIRYI